MLVIVPTLFWPIFGTSVHASGLAWAHHSAMEKHSDRGFLEPPQEGPLFAARAAASHLLHGALANGSYHCVRFLKLSFYFRPHNCH